MRPHVKTVKNAEIVRKVFAGGTVPITVSTLAEAEHFFEDGFTDVLYAVGVAPVKLPRAEALVRRGCALKVILDNPGAAQTLRDFCVRRDLHIPALVEIDSDDHRAGVRGVHGTARGGPLPRPARWRLAPGRDPDPRRQLLHLPLARQDPRLGAPQRSSMLAAARRLREAGFPCPVVSVGSTPTVLFGETFEGIDEVRPGSSSSSTW